MAVVIDHHLDSEKGWYLLRVGDEIWDDQPDPEDEDSTIAVLVGHENVEDFVFDADDERWADKSYDEITKTQRAEVAKVLADRAEAAGEAERREEAVRTPMPGVGEEL